MGIQERCVGQELPRCTGFCLGLRTQGGEGIKLGGIKYGVWQLHILLMGYGGRRMDLSEVDRFGDVHYSTSPVASIRSGCRFFSWAMSLVLRDFSCIGGVSGLFDLYRISSALSMFPLRWEYTRSVASSVGVGVPGVAV